MNNVSLTDMRAPILAMIIALPSYEIDNISCLVSKNTWLCCS
ncbi:MAG: hypothetical protein RBT05_07580 [Bacteroidales bacterium]|nr:hypothetical protein [Bacteroidales bacterium]